MRDMLSRTAWSSSITRMRGTGGKFIHAEDDRKIEMKLRGVAGVRLMFGVIGAFAVSRCVSGPGGVGVPAIVVPPPRALTLRVQVAEGTALVVRDVRVEDYVAVTALSELHPDVADEKDAARMFDVQAVIARTYAAANRGRHAKDGF